jgi:pyrophosphatase PpaX
MARVTLKHVDLLAPFEVIVGAEATTRHKPDPDPLLVGASRLGVPVDGSIYVGDAPNDILAARAAGMIDVWAAWGPFPFSELEAFTPTHTLQTPMEMLDLIARIDAVEGARA